MLSNRFFPYSSMQEINLDWILTKIKNILRFVPDDGAVGQILRRTAHGAEWSDEQGAGGSVTSVNGMQGAVVLTASDVGALPDTYAAPVDSVNGQTGAVVLDAGDVGALPDTTVIPSDTSDLTNNAGFVDATGAAAAAPVQSVNGQTGNVVLSIPSYVESTPTLTRSSGSGSVVEAKCYRYGNVVHIFLGFENSASVAAGGNLFVGTISDIPFPKVIAIGMGYYTNVALGASIDSAGNIQIRVLISTLSAVSSPSRARIEITYITE